MRAKQNHVFILLVLGSHSACPGEHINEVGFDSTSNTNWGLEVREEAREGLGKMRAFAWMQDLGRSTGGKIISLLLALAMIFSYSNIFVYSAKAFADENVTTETQTDGDQPEKKTNEGAENENQNEGSNTQNGNSDTGINIVTNTEGGTETGGDEGDTTNTENNSGDTTDPDQSEITTEPYTFIDGVLTINGNIAGIETLNQTKALEIVKELNTTAKDVKEINICNVSTIAAYSFHNTIWTELSTVVISGVNTIKDHAFSGLQKLTNLTLNNVGTIEESDYYGKSNAFAECKALTTVTLNNVSFVGSEAFRQCNNLNSLNMNDVKELGTSAFSYCYGLTSLKLDNVKMSGNSVFFCCNGLTDVIIKDMNISDYAFVGCTSLETLTLTNVPIIGKYAFSTWSKQPACEALKNVTMNNVGTIGQYAFYNCINLQTVNMESIRAIDVGAFWYCTNLKTVNSLSNVSERVNGFAFFGCENLEGLSIADLTKMGFIGSNDEIMERVKAILAGTFKLDDAENIKELELENGWTSGAIGKSENWNKYDNGTQVMQQARWEDSDTVVAEVKVDATYTGEKQMDYIFVADLSASMAYFGNTEDKNARFYDMQSKLLDMTGQLLDTPGYDCNVAIVTFGGLYGSKATHDNSGFLSEKDVATAYINGLKPLNENTDYGLGLQEAQKLAKENKDKGRNTVVVFLSDGAPTANSSGDQDGTKAANEIRNMGVPIYGVLHSPTSGQHDKALNVMQQVCGNENVSEAFDTESFGKAMNAAFSQVYGTNVVTIPVNAVDFDLDEATIEASAGDVSYENGIITWTIKDMPFAQHTLTYKLALKDENANRIGTYTYSINNGNNVSFNNQGGAAAGIDLTLSRTVADQTPVPTPNPGTDTTTTTTTTVVAPAAPAALAAPAGPAAPAAADATPIADDPLPMAGPTQENISDDETPMASVYDEPHCWVHILMIIGMIITAIYGAAVAIRRSSNNRNMGELERDLTEEREISYSSSHARNHA